MCEGTERWYTIILVTFNPLLIDILESTMRVNVSRLEETRTSLCSRPAGRP